MRRSISVPTRLIKNVPEAEGGGGGDDDNDDDEALGAPAYRRPPLAPRPTLPAKEPMAAFFEGLVAASDEEDEDEDEAAETAPIVATSPVLRALSSPPTAQAAASSPHPMLTSKSVAAMFAAPKAAGAAPPRLKDVARLTLMARRGATEAKARSMREREMAKAAIAKAQHVATAAEKFDSRHVVHLAKATHMQRTAGECETIVNKAGFHYAVRSASSCHPHTRRPAPV